VAANLTINGGKMKLEGQVAIVAGGGQGIGEGIARCLAEEGADIAVLDINEEIAKKVADDLKAMGRKTLPVVADLTDEAQVKKAVQETIDHFGRVDILINNVGGVASKTIQRMMEKMAQPVDETLPDFMNSDGEIWDHYYELNLKSHVMLSQAVTPQFIKQQSGKIINISSIAGRGGDPGQMHYAAMKAGDISLTWTLARALAPHNVRVNCICPGFVYTPLWNMGAVAQHTRIREDKAQGKEVPARFAREDFDKLTPREYWLKYIVKPATPLGQEQTAEDMGKAAVFLVSDDSKNITGQTLHVDGGIVMR